MTCGNERPPRGYGGASLPSCGPRSLGGRRRESGPKSNCTTTGLSSRFPASCHPSFFPQKTTSATSETRIICTESMKKRLGDQSFLSLTSFLWQSSTTLLPSPPDVLTRSSSFYSCGFVQQQKGTSQTRRTQFR